MNIYKISCDKKTASCYYESAIVIADSAEEAKTFHPDGRQNIPIQNYEVWKHGEWTNNPEDVEVQWIGIAISGQKKGVLQASYVCG